jgi:protein TonB
MTANGFLEQRTARPVSFGAVVLLHGAAIAAVLLIKGPGWVRAADPPLVIKDIDLQAPPPEIESPPPLEKQIVQVPTISRLDVPPRVIPTPVSTIPASGEPIGPSSAVIGSGTLPPSGIGTRPEPRIEPRSEVPPRVERPSVRVDSQFDPRFASALQPPYPTSEERNEREGIVRLRVTIGADGRVKSAERVSATSDAFWQATQRHALSRWRFKPATVDGRPVESSKVLSIRFQLPG